MAKKFNFEFDKFMLFPKQYKFKTSKQAIKYFDYLENVEKIPYLTYKNKLIEYWDEKINVIFSRKLFCSYLAIFIGIISIILAISHITPLSYIMLSIGVLFVLGRQYFHEKFQSSIRERNFNESILSPTALDELEKNRN